MEEIASAVVVPDVRVVAVVGCSKNTGKTTTLNRVLDGLSGADGPVGVLSIGIDGEESDFWYGVDKPSVLLRPGSLVATGDRALAAGTAVAEVVDNLGVSTPVGELVIGRVLEAGAVLLAGVRHKADLSEAVSRMKSLGAARILLDGSYQRLAAADPEISDGVILSTGAVVGGTVALVAERTAEVLSRLQMPPTGEPGAADLLDRARALGLPLIRVGDEEADPLRDPSDLRSHAAAGPSDGTAVTIAFPGAVTDEWVRAASAPSLSGAHVIFSDPTRMFASTGVLAGFRAAGGKLAVIRTIRLLAVTVNPFGVTGASLPGQEILEAVREVVHKVAVHVPVIMFEDGK